jgi:gliding motility-associated-like protein
MRKILFILFGLFEFLNLFGTHNRAGEITYRYISGLTYEFEIVTYTNSAPYAADRPSLDINWGDGTSSTLNRYLTIMLPNITKENHYKGVHTFSGQGSYVISMEDPNRNYGVVNIPNSINIPFYIETHLNISPFIGINNSPVLLNAPIDNGCTGNPFLHNPAAYDPDGDSLAYELVNCKGDNGNNIIGYSIPAYTQSFSINPITGTLSWINPVLIGEYNVAFLIKEYRNGFLIGSVMRDMQITIASCNNHPPQIESLSDTCVEVGQNLHLLIKANDIDNDRITLTGDGGPLQLQNSPANFPSANAFGYVQSHFNWTPICEHVKLYPYQMIFKATDNGSTVNQVDIKTMFITVVAPAPKNLIAKAQANHIDLHWNASYCTNIKGYDIYRHQSYIGYHAATCETGVPAWTGYVKIGSTTGLNDTTFLDNNNGYGLIHGHDYCYMVVAVFNDGAESYPSLEACASLIKDVPIITHVTVDSTDINQGKITVVWSEPDSLDLNQTPGPFKYLIYHNNLGFGQPMNLIDSLDQLSDTIFQHQQINTQSTTNFYQVDFINNSSGNRFLIGNTHFASNIFIQADGRSNRVELSWNELAPWNNYRYVIYKQNQNGTFDSIAYTSNQNYTDSNLVNGQTYCYLVKGVGEYGGNGLMKPLLNWSQIVCGIPVDDEAPCAPILQGTTDCISIENQLVWDNPNNRCARDVVAYKLYYKPNNNSDYTVIYNPLNSVDTSYLHQDISSIVGCYFVTAIDSFANESAASNMVCIDLDSCRLYRLPNVYTPNGDGINDYFVPYPYDFVEKVNMQIFNRWGSLVFKTEDPDINWNGEELQTKNECSEGVYFYVCEVFETRLNGLEKRILKGSVSLYR